jgi:hypothetical protein
VAVTFNDIVQRVKQQLLGYTRDQASITYLAQPMTATDTTFSVDVETVTALSRGLAEINDEMLLIKKYDRTSGVVTIFGGAATGRGVEATTAASHAMGDIVTADPRYPRTRIKEAINDTIRGMYPDVWVFGETEFPWQAARYEYPLPAEVEQVYKVTSNTIGPSGVWFPNSSWRFNPQASITPGQVKPTPAPTGKSIQIMRDFIVPGRNVRVIYQKAPTTFTADTDLLTGTGFPERYVDILVYGACWRLLPAYDAARLQQQSIEANERAPLVPPGSAANISREYQRLYQTRLIEERDRLFELYENYSTFNS